MSGFRVIGADARALAELRSADLDLLQSLHGLESSPSSTNEGGASISVIDASATVPWFSRAIQLRAQAVSAMPFSITKGRTDVTESPEYARMIAKLKGLLWHAESDLVLFGAGYWLKEQNKFGKNTTPRWVAAHTIQPITNTSEGLVGFKRIVGGESKSYPVDRFVYFWLPSFDNEVGPGDGPGRVALEAAGVLRNTDRMVAAYFKRGAIKVTVLSVAPNTHQDEIAKLESWWKRMATSVSNAFTAIGLRSTVTPTVLGDSLKDTSATELTEQKREDIATAMGIPQSLLWSASAYATARHEDRLTFVEQTVIPQCQSIHEETLNTQLFGPEGLTFRFHPEKLPIMQDAQLNKAQAVSQLVGVGVPVLAVDEARKLIGYEPMQAQPPSAEAVKTGNDQTKALRQWRDAAVKRVKEGKSAAFDFQTEAEIPDDLRQAVSFALQSVTTAGEVRAIFEDTRSVKILHRFERRAQRHEKNLAAVIRTLFNRQSKEIIAELAEHRSVNTPFDFSKWEEEFRDTVRPVLQTIAESTGQQALDDYAIEMDFDVSNPLVASFLDGRAQRFAQRVSETTWDQLRASLNEGLGAGENISQLEQRVLDVMQGRIASTPETIARTEVIGTMNGGTLEAWEQSRAVRGKTWVSTLDPRTRETHAQANGQTVGLDEDFVVGSGRGPAPGQMGSAEEDINCRCTMIAQLEK
jgi:hypothetical protein